jgi:ABC-type multidrug transport system fused ATPase/permease subunit
MNDSSSSRTDPFAQRVGKPLLWRNVQMKATVVRSMMCVRIGKLIVLHDHVADDCDDFLQNKKDSDGSKVILKDVWGSIPNGRVTAIMGPSGAGKVCSNIHVDILIAASRLHGATYVFYI